MPFKLSPKLSRIVVLLIAVAVIFGGFQTITAQGAYVKTFDLKLPVAAGAYKGVDPKGAKITWWHQNTGTRADVVKAIVDTFNKNNPWGITVNAVYKGAYTDIFQANIAAIQTGDMPQLTVAYQNEAATYQNAKALIDLNDFYNDPVLGFGTDATSDLFQGFFDADVNTQFGGQRLGVPAYRSMEVLYYNVDALTKLGYTAAPKTWDEFEQMACKFVKSGAGTDGYVVRTDASFVAAATFAQGGSIYDTKSNKFTYTVPEAKVMPTTMQKMITEGCAKVLSGALSDQNSFVAQQALFYTGSSSGLPFIDKGIKDSGKSFVYDIAAIPFKDKPVQNVYGASLSIPKSTPEQQLAAWLFLRWYDEPDQQATWAKASGYFPVRKSTAAGLTDFFAANKPYASAFNLLGNTTAEPPVAAYSAVRPDAATAMNNILDGASVDDEFAKLNDLANKHLDENKPGGALPTPIPTKVPTAAATTAATMAPTTAK